MPAAPFVVVFSRQRSASTELASAISQRLPCAANVDEVFWNPALLDSQAPVNRLLRSPHCHASEALVMRSRAQRLQNPLVFLQVVRNVSCRVLSSEASGKGCEEQCTLVAKLFDAHNVWHLGSLLSSGVVCPIVLERPVAEEECSKVWADRTHDFSQHLATHLARNESASAAFAQHRASCNTTASPSFKRGHDAWFAKVRGKLREANLSAVDVMFEEVTRNVERVLDRVGRLCGVF